MKEPNVVRVFVVAAVVAVLAIPAVAGATPSVNNDLRSAVRVSYAGLDLSNKAGLDVFYGRLKAAS